MEHAASYQLWNKTEIISIADFLLSKPFRTMGKIVNCSLIIQTLALQKNRREQRIRRRNHETIRLTGEQGI